MYSTQVCSASTRYDLASACPSSPLFKHTTLALNEERMEQTDCPDTHVISPAASASPAADRWKLGICVGQERVYHSALNIGSGWFEYPKVKIESSWSQRRPRLILSGQGRGKYSTRGSKKYTMNIKISKYQIFRTMPRP